MTLYLLIAVACYIKEPSKTFQLTCRSKVVRFYTSEKECKNEQPNSMKCIEVRIGK